MVRSRAGNEIREAFLRFFESRHGHTRVRSSGLVPGQSDESLLFTNAGMVQFKDALLGREMPGYTRATSVQKCMRAGGKHNDLDNVGFTPRHHTFFEMLGNFSFGDYFKEEAIGMAWEFVTRDLAIPQSRLRVTVFDEDDESEAIWSKILNGSVPIVRMGKKDNFWSMGDGPGLPCGPCTEIFFDTGREDLPDDDRFLEIWNLVFMQYKMDGVGGLELLPKPCVDTGMGLERVSAVLQGVDSNFDSDLLQPLVRHADEILRSKGSDSLSSLAGGFSQRVIADHVRASAFLIADGVVPSNVGRGYVLRRLIRRAAGFAHRAGVQEPFLGQLLPTLHKTFQWNGENQYPELLEREKTISSIIESEETIFFRTLSQGMRLLNEHMAMDVHHHGKNRVIPGETAFKLYDTFGFPLDLTLLVSKERGFSVDTESFDELMAQQRERSGAGMAWGNAEDLEDIPASNVLSDPSGVKPCTQVKEWARKLCECPPVFTGYESLVEENAGILAVAQATKENRFAWVAMSPCPFYPEGGGQVGDRGKLLLDGISLPVLNAVRPYKGGIALLVDCDSLGRLPRVGEKVKAFVDSRLRRDCSIHHTATHLLHAALRKVLGDQVLQAGSLVSPDRLRFDFAFPKALTTQQLELIEDMVNDFILEDLSVKSVEMPLEAAKQADALMLFGERYEDIVRVVSVNGPEPLSESCPTKIDRSAELCGGTHVQRLSLLYPFKIVSESSVAAGTRRIEAVASRHARAWFKRSEAALANVGKVVKCNETNEGAILRAVERVLDREKQSKKTLNALRAQLFSSCCGSPTLQDENVCLHLLPDVAPGDAKESTKALQEFSNLVVEKMPDYVHVIVSEEKRIVVSTKCSELHAGTLLRSCFDKLRELSGGEKTSGKGGGGKNFAQGQFDEKCPSDLGQLFQAVLASVRSTVKK